MLSLRNKGRNFHDNPYPDFHDVVAATQHPVIAADLRGQTSGGASGPWIMQTSHNRYDQLGQHRHVTWSVINSYFRSVRVHDRGGGQQIVKQTAVSRFWSGRVRDNVCQLSDDCRWPPTVDGRSSCRSGEWLTTASVDTSLTFVEQKTGPSGALGRLVSARRKLRVMDCVKADVTCN